MNPNTDKPRLLRATVARFAYQPKSGRAHWWLMDNPEKGWASFGRQYNNVTEILETWDVVLGNCGQDEFGTYVEIKPAEVKS